VTLGLSKVTRQAAQRRRNPIEDGVLVPRMAQPCHLDGDISPSKDVTQPLTLTLSRKGRGNCYRGAMRFAYWHPTRLHSLIPRPLPQGERGWLPRCNALRLLAPYLSPARGEGIVTADDYAALIDPTGLLHPAPHPVVGGEAHSRCLVPHPLEC